MWLDESVDIKEHHILFCWLWRGPGVPDERNMRQKYVEGMVPRSAALAALTKQVIKHRSSELHVQGWGLYKGRFVSKFTPSTHIPCTVLEVRGKHSLHEWNSTQGSLDSSQCFHAVWILQGFPNKMIAVRYEIIVTVAGLQTQQCLPGSSQKFLQYYSSSYWANSYSICHVLLIVICLKVLDLNGFYQIPVFHSAFLLFQAHNDPLNETEFFHS